MLYIGILCFLLSLIFQKENQIQLVITGLVNKFCTNTQKTINTAFWLDDYVIKVWEIYDYMTWRNPKCLYMYGICHSMWGT